MKSIRKLFAATVLAAGGLAAAAAGISIATAADDAPPPGGPGEFGGPGGPGGPGGWHHGHHGEGRFFKELNLTDAQKASIKAIMLAAGPQMKSIHEQMHANEMKLHAMSPTDSNYTGMVAEVSTADGTLHSQMTTQKAEIRAQVFKVLTPTQQTQLTTLEAQAAQQHAAWENAHPRGAPPAN